MHVMAAVAPEAVAAPTAAEALLAAAARHDPAARSQVPGLVLLAHLLPGPRHQRLARSAVCPAAWQPRCRRPGLPLERAGRPREGICGWWAWHRAGRSVALRAVALVALMPCFHWHRPVLAVEEGHRARHHQGRPVQSPPAFVAAPAPAAEGAPRHIASQ